MSSSNFKGVVGVEGGKLQAEFGKSCRLYFLRNNFNKKCIRIRKALACQEKTNLYQLRSLTFKFRKYIFWFFPSS